MVATQPPRILNVRQTRPPQQIIRPMRLVQPKQTVKKMIVVKNPGLHFYTDPLATPSDVAVDKSEPPTDAADEGQFITPDQIQEGFDEIEKYLGAEDDNIFENVGNAQDDLGRGAAQSAKYP